MAVWVCCFVILLFEVVDVFLFRGGVSASVSEILSLVGNEVTLNRCEMFFYLPRLRGVVI